MPPSHQRRLRKRELHQVFIPPQIGLNLSCTRISFTQVLGSFYRCATKGSAPGAARLGVMLRPERTPQLYALVDDRLPARRPLEQVIELYGTRKKAEATLSEVLRDEPLS